MVQLVDDTQQQYRATLSIYFPNGSTIDMSIDEQDIEEFKTSLRRMPRALGALYPEFEMSEL